MQKPCNIVDDERPIKSIITVGDNYTVVTVGAQGITAIVAYNETGQNAYVHYYAIYRGDWIQGRINGASVESVAYGDAPGSDGAL